MMSEKICLPVHRGRGLRIAGCGTFPSHVDRNIRRFITSPCEVNSKKRKKREKEKVRPPQVFFSQEYLGSFLFNKESQILEAK